MFDKNIDAYLILSEANRRYFTGIDTSFGLVLLTEREKIFFTDFRYESYARKELSDFTVITVKFSELYEFAARELKKLGVTTVGYEENYITVGEFSALQSALNGFSLVPASGALALKRAVKTEEEISKIENSQRIAEKALAKVIPLIKPGVTEREISAELTFVMLQSGADGLAFDNIVSFGENSANPHHHPSDKKLDKNELILIDFGARKVGYDSHVYARQPARRTQSHSRHSIGSAGVCLKAHKSRHYRKRGRLACPRIHTGKRLRKRIRSFSRSRRGNRNTRRTATRRKERYRARSGYGSHRRAGHIY